MKKGISGWAFIDRTPEVCFKLAQKYGFDGVELVLGNHGPVQFNSTEEDMKALRKKAEKYGLSCYSLVCDLCWDYSLTSDDETVRKKAEEIIAKQLEIASWLGCDTILALPGMVAGLTEDSEVVPYHIAYDRALEAIRKLAPIAEKYKVKIGLENVWNKFLLSPLEMRDFIDKVGSEYVGAYFDVGNVVLNGYPEHWIDILSHRITKVHFKDFKRSIGTLGGFVDILEGDVNYKAVIDSLRCNGYDGWVTAEVFPDADKPEKVLEVNSAAVDCILKM
ncbi:MAG: sugar phosphate isomerase/epimerase [Clostridia bacterium]|nr:sugar phosphate isomerase/epimerase [Clostridia bacterium]